MAFDIYVGSLTRYHTGDWENPGQRVCRELGLEYQLIRPDDDEDDEAEENDPLVVRDAVRAWRNALSDALAGRLGSPLDWNEGPDAPYFTDRPGWEGFSDLLTWAAHAEHPRCPLPEHSLEDWTASEAYQASVDDDFATRYPSLLRGEEMWLPQDFDFTFTASSVAGHPTSIGSTQRLLDELRDLNALTFRATRADLRRFKQAGADPERRLEPGARFALAVWTSLAEESVRHRLPMLLDY